MRVFVFGNEDLEMDSLPLKLVEELKKQFPNHTFLIQDPNEEWDVSEPFYVLDTVVGLQSVTLFDSLDAFVSAPRMGMHDFDALTNLRFLQKLGKLPDVKIIGVPPTISKEDAFFGITSLLE